MRTRSAVTTAALVLFGVVLAACDLGVPAPDDSGEPAPTETTTQAQPDPSASDPGSLEEDYNSYDLMDEYAYRLRDDFIEPWLTATWPSMELPRLRYVASGESGFEGCLDYEGERGRYTSESYEYCPPDESVYVGQDTLWEFFQRTGDAGPAMGMAHEYGHHIQYQLGLEPPSTAAESVDFENQADCLAGTWARYADQQHWLEDASESPNGRSDLDDIELLFPLIASAEDEEDRDHGTQEEREEAFYDGYERGPAGCGLRAG
jgi:hypothetical protein